MKLVNVDTLTHGETGGKEARREFKGARLNDMRQEQKDAKSVCVG